MTQKVLKVGSSAAVTIPKELLQEFGLHIGDQVQVEGDKKRRIVVVKPLVRVEKELVDWTDRFIEKYRKALEQLAQK
jgi:putative addiction module antidote